MLRDSLGTTPQSNWYNRAQHWLIFTYNLISAPFLRLHHPPLPSPVPRTAVPLPEVNPAFAPPRPGRKSVALGNIFFFSFFPPSSFPDVSSDVLCCCAGPEGPPSSPAQHPTALRRCQGGSALRSHRCNRELNGWGLSQLQW